MDILIRTLADTHGAEAVTASLGKVKAAASSAAGSTAELGSSQASLTQFQKDSANPVLADQAEKTAALEKESLRAATGHRAHNFAARELNKELGILGHILNSTLGKFAIPIAGIVAGYKLWRERVDELVESMTGVELPDIAGHTGRVEAAAKAYEEYATQIADSVAALHSANSEHENSIKILDATFANIKKVQQAKKEAELAGAKTPEQTQEIENRYATQTSHTDKEQRDRTAGLQRKLKDDQTAEFYKLLAAERAIKVPSERFDKEVLSKVIATGEEAKKKLPEQREKADRATESYNKYKMGGYNPFAGGMYEKAYAEEAGVETLQQQIAFGDVAQRKMDSYTTKRGQKSKLTNQRTDLEKNIQKLGQDIPIQEGINDQTDEAQAQIDAINRTTAANKRIAEVLKEQARIQEEYADAMEAHQNARAESLAKKLKDTQEQLANLRRL